ncbi:hypothetical protein GXM_08747 [Nostoc sphaeroides CCNUC1]|uniref:Uncharacterized protein n=1 Tax=Nostoc sphaeroides CCNUC1 TaxID=2653204 RepID=A0A5P8WEL4_9NOSO|nr:hypothetical protein GXM_08747 [Nostoc sphaeroides CCNUC1]
MLDFLICHAWRSLILKGWLHCANIWQALAIYVPSPSQLITREISIL